MVIIKSIVEYTPSCIFVFCHHVKGLLTYSTSESCIVFNFEILYSSIAICRLRLSSLHSKSITALPSYWLFILSSAAIRFPLSVSISRIKTLPAESHSITARTSAESGSIVITVSRHVFVTITVSLIVLVKIRFLLAQLTLDRAIVRMRAIRNALDGQTEFRQLFSYSIQFSF